MLNFIRKPVNILDRQNLEIIPLDNDYYQSYDNNNFSKWIICNGQYKSDTSVITGVFGAVTTSTFSIKGHGLVIKTTGYYTDDSVFSLIKPGKSGHMSYIDGCSNKNIVSPFRNGDPCINYLYFPTNITQTMHTHPSLRIGMILSGNGVADINGKHIALNTGDMFILEKFTQHRFLTTNSDMSLLVFHPDSDDGPTDEKNPMKSRTYF